VCLSVCVHVRVDLPEVWLKLLINNKAHSDDDDEVISEFDKVLFICTSTANPPAVSWR